MERNTITEKDVNAETNRILAITERNVNVQTIIIEEISITIIGVNKTLAFTLLSGCSAIQRANKCPPIE